MTVETRTTIQIDDVLALEVGCKTCGSRVRYPLLKIQADHFRSRPHACPNCKDALFPAGGPAVNRLADLTEALQTLIKAESEAIIRLEIADLRPSPPRPTP